MGKMKTILIALVCAIMTLGLAMAAPVATAPGHNKLLCFDGTTDGYGYGGTCTLMGNGARGPATLDNTDGDPDGSYSGVYVMNSVMYGQNLADVGQLQFEYTGDATAGSPRFSIPIDTNDDGLIDFWAYVSAYYCNDGAGLVDVINDATCTIYVSNDPLVSYENWAAFSAEFPDGQIATDNYVFIVADDAGLWTVEGVKFGKVMNK
ncbi:MAG TPA: hypothetical protein VK158_02855 [Acidobacteriota bacterium]|nr:hypothetical protein [Acidobacteriota bacterium]